MLVYAGDVEAGERAIAPFRALAEPVVDMLRPMPYAEMYRPPDAGYRPVAVGRTIFVDTVDRDAAATILDRIESSTAAAAVVQLRVLGGAMARVPSDATAFAHRERRILGNAVAMYGAEEERPVHDAWVADLAGELSGGDPAAYAGFLGDVGERGRRAPPTRARPGSGWRRSRPPMTRRTCSG